MDLSIKSINVASILREHPAEILVRRSAIAIAVVLLLCYAYLASASVFHAVVQRSAQAQAEQVKTTLSDLEREYYSLSKSIDVSGAGAAGLARVENKNFVERAVLVGQATLPANF